MDNNNNNNNEGNNRNNDATQRKVILTKQAVKIEANKQGHSDVNTISKLTLQRRELTGLGNGLHGMINLVYLDLSRNMLSSLNGLRNCPALSTLILYYNRLENLKEIRKLEALKLLRDLDLRLNPFTREEYYRTYIVHHLPFLSRLDERDVAPAERRVAADVLREVDVTLLGDFGRGDDDDDDNSYGEDDEIRFYNHSRNTNNNSVGSPSRLDVDNFMMEEGIHVSNTTIGNNNNNNNDISQVLESVDQMNNNSNRQQNQSVILREKTRMDEDIDAVLGELTNCISEVALPHRLSMNPQTIVHVPSVVARVAQPALRSIVRRVILRQSRQSKEYTNRLKRFQEEFDDYEVKLKNGVSRVNKFKAQLSATENDNERLVNELKNARTKLVEQENRFLAEKAELASAEIVNSCLESINMLRESHRALMNNNTDLRNELESVKMRYKTEANRWKSNFEELRKVYESRLEYESTTATTMGVGSSPRKGKNRGNGLQSINGTSSNITNGEPHTRNYTFRIPEKIDAAFQSEVQETNQMAQNKVEEYINARRYSPNDIEEDKNDDLNHDNGRQTSIDGKKLVMDDIVNAAPSKEYYNDTNDTTSPATITYNNNNDTILSSSKASRIRRSANNSNNRGNEELRSPYKKMLQGSKNRNDEDAISAGEWASALGMAGERLKLASPQK